MLDLLRVLEYQSEKKMAELLWNSAETFLLAGTGTRSDETQLVR